MAEKRMISKNISQSRKVNSLSLKGKLLFTWAIPWFDNHGYLEVEPDFLKFNIFPRVKEILLQELPGICRELTDIKLWILYKHQKTGKLIAYDPKFKVIQTLRQDRLGEPTYKKEDLQELPDICQPLPTIDGLLRESSATSPQGKVREGKVSKERERLACGEFSNIFLIEEEKKKLQIKYGEKAVQDKIESFSNSLKSQPQKYSKYKDHYATLNNWLRNDGNQSPNKKETKITFPNCPKCGKETTQEDIKNFDSCPACYKPLPPEKLKELLHGIGKDMK